MGSGVQGFAFSTAGSVTWSGQAAPGATVQAGAWTELSDRLGVCRECRPAAQTTHNLKHTPYGSEDFSSP